MFDASPIYLGLIRHKTRFCFYFIFSPFFSIDKNPNTDKFRYFYITVFISFITEIKIERYANFYCRPTDDQWGHQQRSRRDQFGRDQGVREGL